MHIVVQKFGGTSVQDTAAMQRVIAIVTNYGISRSSRPLVVLSACAGVTNALIRIGELALLKKMAAAHEDISALETRHHTILHNFHLATNIEQGAAQQLRTIWRDLRTIIRAIELLGELTPKMKDRIMSCGERASTIIFAEALRQALRQRRIAVELLDAREFFKTDTLFTSARPNLREIRSHMKPIVKRLTAGTVGVTQGFIGSTLRGETTTIGRGGSDFSAAMMGVATKAKEIQIWTDVAGIYTCDPRICPDAYAQPSVSFEEASTMAYYGAKVLHPETIWPAVEAKIPVRVLSSIQPKLKGTTIVADRKGTPEITGIAITKNVELVSINANTTIPQAIVAERTFEALQHDAIIPLAVSQSFDNILLVLEKGKNSSSLENAHKTGVTIKHFEDHALISLIGHGLTNPGIAKKLFSAIASVNCAMINYGGKQNVVNIAVHQDAVDTVARQIHNTFF
jgi:aspartate kinase